MFGRRKRKPESADGVDGADRVKGPDDLYVGLRARVLDTGARGLIAARPEHPRIAGVVIDVPSSGGFATIVALGDNTTSLYTSVGGGVIGGGEHEPVVAANRELLAKVDEYLLAFSIGANDSLPGPGTVRYHVIGAVSQSTADVPEASFWGQVDHPLMPVIVATQQLISVLRTVAQQRRDA
jgi:hypothetical protein